MCLLDPEKKDCCQTDSNVNYYPNCYNLLQSNSNNDNSSSENNNNHHLYHSGDDDISYSNEKARDIYVAQTVISESCKTVSDKLNKKYPSVSGSPPSSIVIVDISSNILDDFEDDNFEMHSDIDKGEPSLTNNVPTGIIEQNLTIENDMIIVLKKIEIYVEVN